MAADAPLLVVEAIDLYERPVVLRLPFRFGIVTLTQCPQAFAHVRVRAPDGRTAWGAAAELMAPKWFDKNPTLSNEDNFRQLRTVLRRARTAYLSDQTAATAFGQFARHHAAHESACGREGLAPLVANYGPALIDRAILDALCRLCQVSFYTAMGTNAVGVGRGLAPFAAFDSGAFLQALHPMQSIGARHTVGMLDAITAQDLAQRVNDGLPETLEEVIARYGHRWFKIKVRGQLREDIDRLSAIAAVLDRLPDAYGASLDGNEQYQSAEEVAQLTAAIRQSPRLARLWSSIRFIEQPISRRHALDVDLHGVEMGKPVIIDESDGTLDAFVQARARGYAGVSSKTCKGIYRSVLNAMRCAAWNRDQDEVHYFMSGEDLTAQAGLAVQQDLALVNLLGITHVERNGHHYVNGMAALPLHEQMDFLRAHPDLYEQSDGAVRLTIKAGRIRCASLDCVGYATAAEPDFSAMQALGEGL